MNLLDRYLQAIRLRLPPPQQEDIVRELAEDLRSEVEAREAQVGHALTDAEVEPILLRWGSPAAIAQRYAPSRPLIGPLLLPLYWRVLRVVLLWVFVPLALLVSGPAVIAAAHPWAAALAALGQYFQTATSGFAMITLTFVILERVHPDHPVSTAWNPRDLPAVRLPERNELSRTEAVFEVIFGGWFFFWWAGLVRMPTFGLPLNTVVHVTPAPVWQELYWPILALGASMPLLSAANLVRPWWTPWRAAIRLANQVVTVGLAGWLLLADSWFIVQAPTLAPGQIAGLERALNLGLRVAFFWIVVITLVSLVRHDVPRLRRLAWGQPASNVPTPS